jgi:RNA polymerase sigma-70 factor (ECF subfamily)
MKEHTPEQTWREYRDALHRFIRKRIDDPTVAEDLVQEVLLKAFSQLDRLEKKEKLLAWLYQITRNALIDHFRRSKPAQEFDEAAFAENADMDETAGRELAGCILPFIQQLPPSYQQAVKLSEIEGVKLKEVAMEQGISLSGAKSRVQRGRQMLKTMFLECCRIEQDRRGGVSDYEAKKNCGNCG